MNYSKSTYHTKIYRDFKEIEVGEYRNIVGYYEEFEADIRELDFQEYFEILVAFVNALFQLGKYQKHLLMVDIAIEASVMQNIKSHQDEEDIFHKLLFQKAASAYHTFDLEKTDHILRELIKMNPKDRNASLFLKKCLRRKQPTYMATFRAISIFMFLAAALVICIEFLFIENFYNSLLQIVQQVRNTLFLIGVLALVGGEFLHWWKINREVNNFVKVFRRIKGK